MATKLSTELLIMIINNVQSIQDLYSSLLVNRIWCKVTIPILWGLPLGQVCCTARANLNKLKKKALCVRTYISCMDTQARTFLTQNGFNLSLSPPQATFDYPSFTHKFIINNLVYFVSLYSQEIIGSNQGNYNNSNKDKIIILKSRILFREICKLIINRCTFLDSFGVTGSRDSSKFISYFINYSDLSSSILKLPGAPKVFKKLESFTSKIGDHQMICPLYESLKLICDNILNMDFELNSYSQVKLLAELISVQKYLENLSIVANYHIDHLNSNSLLLWAIISQKETLKSLRLKSVSFYYFKRKSPIGQFISLQELYIENCYGLHELDCSFFASSFTQLSSFHFSHIYNKYPQEFIIKIFETSNTKLRKIYLDPYTTDTFLAILNYCTNIIKLSLENLRPEHVIAILNNNFNELRRFSFDCIGDEIRFNADELLCQMAENVPKSLEIIVIKMDYDNPWIFRADSLRKFFEGWCCKGGEGNKKLRRFRIKRSVTSDDLPPPFDLSAISSEHFKVIEEYGIQFDIKE